MSSEPDEAFMASLKQAGYFSAKTEKCINKQVKRHGVDKAVDLANSYGQGLVEGLACSKEQARDSRHKRILQNFGSLDGARTKSGGHRGFSLTNLGLALIETASAFIDYENTRNFNHKVAKVNDEWFYHPGIQAKS
jgi:hypothetical protein